MAGKKDTLVGFLKNLSRKSKNNSWDGREREVILDTVIWLLEQAEAEGKTIPGLPDDPAMPRSGTMQRL